MVEDTETEEVKYATVDDLKKLTECSKQMQGGVE
jgi:hypothetical protein